MRICIQILLYVRFVWKKYTKIFLEHISIWLPYELIHEILVFFSLLEYQFIVKLIDLFALIYSFCEIFHFLKKKMK